MVSGSPFHWFILSERDLAKVVIEADLALDVNANRVVF